ncbi:MAG: hypothetical protein ACREB2_07315 [Pseudolabrys sp.]
MTADGHYEVTDPNMRAAILRLRSDPAASATMAGAFTQNNSVQLATAIGRMPSEGELYIAHFLGSDGASRLINTAARQPAVNAAEMFPAAAAANPGIFLNKARQPRSAGEVYATLTGRFEVARASAAPVLHSSTSAQATSPDTAGMTQAYVQVNEIPPAIPVPVAAVPPGARPFFQSMFTDRGGKAVAQTVSNLWAPADGSVPQAPAPSLMHSPFTDSPAAVRKPPGKT